MTPTIMHSLAEAEAKIRLSAAVLTQPGDGPVYQQLLHAAALLMQAREELHQMARAPVAAVSRARLRVIDGGAL